MTHAVKIFYGDGSVELVACGSAAEALNIARSAAAAGTADQIRVIEWAGSELCVWHRDWSPVHNANRLKG